MGHTMNEQQIFLEALDLPKPQQRLEYLDQACAGDAALRKQVESLLAAHERSGQFLDVPACEQIGVAALAPERPGATIEESMSRPRRELPPDTEAEPTNGEPQDLSLDFLEFSGKPGSLGRLAHYEVVEVLGRGGFGTVVKAFDEKLHRMVAIKIMSATMASTSPARKRFLREARSSAAIRHENIVDIHAIEEQPIPFLVMEYVDGETLQERLDRSGPLDALETVRIGVQIAYGLAAAHAMGKIHRDIKPANILLDHSGQRVKITDFGLARAADDASLTQSGYIAGTPMYMAPEQAQGGAIDFRTDLFSFGSVLYVMCSGRPPFRASTTLAVLKRVAEDTPRPIREIIPDVPQWLIDVISRLHAKKPEDRFQSAKEVADVLASAPQQASAHSTAAPGPPIVGPGMRFRRSWVAVIAVLLLAVVGTTVAEWNGAINLRGNFHRLFARNDSAISTERESSGETGPASSRSADSSAVEEVLTLFNGQDLSGWRVIGHNGWSVKDGVLFGKCMADESGYLLTDRNFADYELELECRIAERGDSGLFLRAWPDADLSGRDFVELQLVDNSLIGDVTVGDTAKRQHGALLNLAAPVPAVAPTLNAWQQVRVRLTGKHVQVWLDRQHVIDTTLETLPQHGAIALQLCLGKVEFRNIRVRRPSDPQP
jgi:serine/threonine protein kinase